MTVVTPPRPSTSDEEATESPDNRLSAVKRTATALVSRIASSIVMLANYIILARHLSTEEFGVLFIVIGLGQALAAIATLGLPDALVSIVAKYSAAQRNAYIRVAATKSLALILLVFVSSLGFAEVLPVERWLSSVFSNPRVGQAWIYIWGILVAHGLILFSSQLLLSVGRRELSVLLFYTSGPSFLLLALIMGRVIGHQWETEHVLAILIGALTSCALFGGALFLRDIAKYQNEKTAQQDISLMSVALPMMGTRAIVMVEAWAPVWMAGALLSTTAAASFGAALRLLGAILAITQVVNFISRSIIATLIAANDLKRLESYCRVVATVVGGFMLLVTAIAWFGAVNVMSLIYGAEYALGGLMLVIFAAGYSVQWLTGSADMILMMSGRHSLLFWINVLAITAIIGAMFLTMQHWGSLPGAASFSIVLAIKFAVLVWSVKKELGFWSLPTFSRRQLGLGLDTIGYSPSMLVVR